MIHLAPYPTHSGHMQYKSAYLTYTQEEWTENTGSSTVVGYGRYVVEKGFCQYDATVRIWNPIDRNSVEENSVRQNLQAQSFFSALRFMLEANNNESS